MRLEQKASTQSPAAPKEQPPQDQKKSTTESSKPAGPVKTKGQEIVQRAKTDPAHSSQSEEKLVTDRKTKEQVPTPENKIREVLADLNKDLTTERAINVVKSRLGKDKTIAVDVKLIEEVVTKEKAPKVPPPPPSGFPPPPPSGFPPPPGPPPATSSGQSSQTPSTPPNDDGRGALLAAIRGGGIKNLKGAKNRGKADKVDKPTGANADQKASAIKDDEAALQYAHLKLPQKTIELMLNYGWDGKADIDPFIAKLTLDFYTEGLTQHIRQTLDRRIMMTGNPVGDEFFTRAKAFADKYLASLSERKVSGFKESVLDLKAKNRKIKDSEKKRKLTDDEKKTLKRNMGNIDKAEKEIEKLKKKPLQTPRNVKNISELKRFLSAKEYELIRKNIDDEVKNQTMNYFIKEITVDSTTSLIIDKSGGYRSTPPSVESVKKAVERPLKKYGLQMPHAHDFETYWTSKDQKTESQFRKIKYGQLEHEKEDPNLRADLLFPFDRVPGDDFQDMKTYENILRARYKPGDPLEVAAKRAASQINSSEESDEQLKEKLQPLMAAFKNKGLMNE